MNNKINIVTETGEPIKRKRNYIKKYPDGKPLPNPDKIRVICDKDFRSDKQYYRIKVYLNDVEKYNECELTKQEIHETTDKLLGTLKLKHDLSEHGKNHLKKGFPTEHWNPKFPVDKQWYCENEDGKTKQQVWQRQSYIRKAETLREKNLKQYYDRKQG